MKMKGNELKINRKWIENEQIKWKDNNWKWKQSIEKERKQVENERKWIKNERN